MNTVTRRQELIFEKICERILAGDGSGHRTFYRPGYSSIEKTRLKYPTRYKDGSYR
jgi:antirestriction protein ArdC